MARWEKYEIFYVFSPWAFTVTCVLHRLISDSDPTTRTKHRKLAYAISLCIFQSLHFSVFFFFFICEEISLSHLFLFRNKNKNLLSKYSKVYNKNTIDRKADCQYFLFTNYQFPSKAYLPSNAKFNSSFLQVVYKTTQYAVWSLNTKSSVTQSFQFKKSCTTQHLCRLLCPGAALLSSANCFQAKQFKIKN